MKPGRAEKDLHRLVDFWTPANWMAKALEEGGAATHGLRMLVTEPDLELSSDSEVGARPGFELHTRGSL